MSRTALAAGEEVFESALTPVVSAIPFTPHDLNFLNWPKVLK